MVAKKYFGLTNKTPAVWLCDFVNKSMMYTYNQVSIFSYCPGGPDSDFEYSTQSYTGYEVSHQSMMHRAGYSLLKMGLQAAQQTASSGNLTVSLPSENVLFLLTTRTFERLPQTLI